MEKKSKRTSIIAVLIVMVIHVGLLVGGVKLVTEHTTKKIYNQMAVVFDYVDRGNAIKQLSELRGRILEVESLKREPCISQLELLEKLEKIAQTHFTNPYLKDCEFIIPNTFDIGEICKDLISQIDNRIHTIEFDTKG